MKLLLYKDAKKRYALQKQKKIIEEVMAVNDK